MKQRIHLFPFRTQKLSSALPKVLSGPPLGRIGSCRISIKMTVFQAKNGHFSCVLPFSPTARLCFCVARILPLILFSYHSFLRFQADFLSHSHFVKVDIKISRNRVLFSILSHNLSHNPPFLPPVIAYNKAFLRALFLFNDRSEIQNCCYDRSTKLLDKNAGRRVF